MNILKEIYNKTYNQYQEAYIKKLILEKSLYQTTTIMFLMTTIIMIIAYYLKLKG